MKTKVLMTLQVPASTRQRLKVLAAQRGVSIRELVEPLLNQVLASTYQPDPSPDHAPHSN